MKIIYHRTKINEVLLTPEDIVVSGSDPLKPYLKSHVIDSLPAGRCTGVYFNEYPFASGAPSGPPSTPSSVALPFMWSNTDISITDTSGIEITRETDIRDYHHKSGGYIEGFKKIDFLSNDERIRIDWHTKGKMPVCGEFIFLIEQEDCECK